MAEEKKAAPAAPKPPGKGLLLVIVVLVFGNLGGTGFLVSKALQPPPPAVAAKPAAADEAEEEDLGETIGPVVELDTFVINLNEPGSSRYLKAGIDVEVNSAKTSEKLTKLSQIVRDGVLRYLSSLTVADTLGEGGKENIKTQIAVRIEKVLGKGRVKRLFLKEFVVQ